MDLWCCGSGASRPVLQGAVRQLALSAGGQGAVVEWQMRGRDDLEVFFGKRIVFFIWQENVPKSSRPCFHHLLFTSFWRQLVCNTEFELLALTAGPVV